MLFIIAIIPMIRAEMLAKNIIAVMSHHVSLKESIPSILTNTTEVIITIKNNIFSPTDHLPNFVFGFILVVFIFIIIPQEAN